MRWLWVLLLGGCATIFTGSKQTIHVAADQPDALVIVVGEPIAPLLLHLESGSDVAQQVIEKLSPFLPPDTKEELQKLRLEELLTKIALWAKLGNATNELANVQVPDAVKDELTDLLGIQAVGKAPLAVKLRKSREYAVLVYRDGYQIAIGSIEPKFNWVTIVNVLNAFLGVPIDAITGAWFNLTPSSLNLKLAVTGG